MKNRILDLIYPNYCLLCNKIGLILCDSCKKHILESQKSSQKNNLKFKNIKQNFYFSNSKNKLKSIIYQYKLSSIQDLAPILADFYLQILPKDKDFVLIPLPTAKKHTKKRGFDHIKIIAEEIAKQKGWQIITDIENNSKKAQKDLSAKNRHKNVKNAFVINQKLDPKLEYLIIDDIVTTGASVESLAKTLKESGVNNVYLAFLIKN